MKSWVQCRPQMYSKWSKSVVFWEGGRQCHKGDLENVTSYKKCLFLCVLYSCLSFTYCHCYYIRLLDFLVFHLRSPFYFLRFYSLNILHLICYVLFRVDNFLDDRYCHEVDKLLRFLSSENRVNRSLTCLKSVLKLESILLLCIQ